MFDGIQSALDPQGPQAAVLAEIAWVLFLGAAVIFAAVMALAAWAVWRRPRWLAREAAIVGGGIVFPLIVLAALPSTPWRVRPRWKTPSRRRSRFA
jgi:cytochrome c oxidase subunit II